MSDSDIETFVAVTQSSRRAAHYYLGRYRNLNDAVSNFIDRGERGVPRDFDYESDNDASDASEEHVEPEIIVIDAATTVMEQTEPLKEPELKGFMAMQEIEDMDNERINQNTPKNQKTKAKEGSKLSYLLEDVHQMPENKKGSEKKKTDPLPIRELSCESKVFVIWKDGISIGNNFIKTEGEAYENLMKHVRVGQLPENISVDNHIDDCQLVDRSNKMFEEVDLNSILSTC